MAATMAGGSAMRPEPNSPQAMAPSSGPTVSAPSARTVARLRRVAGCSHMRTFIAGASSTRLSVASRRVLARSLAIPSASLAMRSAVAGATTTRSALRDSSMWPISASAVRSKSVRWTGSPARAETLSGVTNSAPPAVSTGTTAAPAFCSRRMSSRLL